LQAAPQLLLKAQAAQKEAPQLNPSKSYGQLAELDLSQAGQTHLLLTFGMSRILTARFGSRFFQNQLMKLVNKSLWFSKLAAPILTFWA
jgi:hypothetical protein